MRIDLATVCDYAIIDQYGKLSILGIFSHIWVANFPAVHPRMHLVLHLKGRRTEIGEHKVRIRFTDDQGSELINGDGTVNFNEPPAGVLEIAAGTVLVFDVPFPHAGTYTFEVIVDDTIRAEIPITVAQSPHPTMPPPKATGLH
ncbi:MAG: hypothetical protein IH616_13660 [Gemmatimonadales bacterium]|jgi:hypothetical protein|nr:hypothetical protein [Gemmatimonadales bacterium]